jgi:glycosyltransferase involved in cell wall biosynthesis
VSLTGFVPRQDVPAYLAAADVLAMPYTSKTLVYAGIETTAVMNPMKMFEYMATGRAIVGTKLPAVAEVLRDGETALLVEPDSAEALRAGIARLVADRSLAERLGKAAQTEARERHSWTAHVHQILDGLS